MWLDAVARRSRLAGVNPACKLLASGAGLVAVWGSHGWLAPGLLAAGWCVAGQCASVRPPRLFFLLWAAPLLILVPSCLAVAVEFSVLPPVGEGIVLGGWEHVGTAWTTPAHLREAGALLLRALAGTGALLFVASTTPFTSLMNALASAHVPDWLADLTGSMFRMVTVFLEEGHVRRLALAARGGWDTFLGSWACAGWWVTGLFVGALRHTRRATQAMEARCGDGLAKRWPTPHPAQPRAWVYAWLAVAGQLGIALGLR